MSWCLWISCIIGVLIISGVIIFVVRFFKNLKHPVSRQRRVEASNTGPNLYFNGLDNLGNTCYMNSSLQVLYSMDGFREYMLKSKCDKPLHRSISRLFRTLNSERQQRSVNPIDFIKTFSRFKPQFGDGRQHDAQEFIRFLIDDIHEEFKEGRDKLRNSGDLLKSLFSGKFNSIVKCTECEKKSNSVEEFWDISLALPEAGDECQLEECLSNYTMSEILDTNSYCNQCKRKTKFSKKLKFEKMPSILMIHLKKFGNNGHKISKEVKICQNLVIKSIQYSLLSFISHRGMSSSSGHYISHCKIAKISDNKWLRFDDETITQIEDTDSIDMSSAYILFYQITN